MTTATIIMQPNITLDNSEQATPQQITAYHDMVLLKGSKIIHAAVTLKDMTITYETASGHIVVAYYNREGFNHSKKFYRTLSYFTHKPIYYIGCVTFNQ